MQQAATELITRWVLSSPVLAWRLKIIARDGLMYGDGDTELNCTVADLLDTDRTAIWRAYLKATGTDPATADEVWREIGGIAGVHATDWAQVRRALLAVDMTWIES